MPLLSGNQNPNQATFPEPTVFGRVAGGIQGVAAGFGNSIENAGHQLGLVKPKPVVVNPGGVPWTPWTPQSDPSQLLVYGNPIPEGVVMTHCMVNEPISYRPYPLSAVSSVPLVATISQQIKIKDGKVIATNPVIKLSKDRMVGADKGRAQIEANDNYVEKIQGREISQEEQDAILASANAPNLVQAGVDLGKTRLEKKVGKVFISDNEPRRAELRLVIHDLIVPATPNAAPQLSMSRYEALEKMWRLFCRNPAGVAPYKDINTVMSDAARINSENSAGHLVQLASMGLNPYQVDTWLVTSFQAQEVPSLDVIVLKITLLEFYSTFETGKPTSADPSGLYKVDTLQPAKPVRPSYVSQAGLG